VVGHVVAPPLTATNDPSRSPQSAEVTAQVEAVLRAQTIAHVDVVGTLSDGAHNGGGLNGQDAYTGRILPVAFDTTQITHPANRSVPKPGDPRHPLAAGAHPPAIGFYPTEGREFPAFTELSPTVKVGSGGSSGNPPGVVTSIAVRRLTPRECERLQGFPDDYTRIPWKKKPADECPDGPRYKALGNSMAVPVMRWIGERIAKVEKE
jgi:DNA (cytosine-5)-methyltransferase 1